MIITILIIALLTFIVISISLYSKLDEQINQKLIMQGLYQQAQDQMENIKEYSKQQQDIYADYSQHLNLLSDDDQGLELSKETCKQLAHGYKHIDLYLVHS